jgi:hypothetical protein
MHYIKFICLWIMPERTIFDHLQLCPRGKVVGRNTHLDRSTEREISVMIRIVRLICCLSDVGKGKVC